MPALDALFETPEALRARAPQNDRAAAPRGSGECGPITERQMLDLLHSRFRPFVVKGGMTIPWYVCGEQVHDTTGLARPVADFIAVDTRPASRLAIHGVEVKVSRSDWRRERGNPWKAAPFLAWTTHWWLAISDPSIASPGELPGGWGLLCVQHRRGTPALRQLVPAPRRCVPAIPPASMASLLRAVARTARARGARDATADTS